MTEKVPIQGLHAYLGLEVEDHPEIMDTVLLKRLYPGSSAHQHLPSWSRRIKGCIVFLVNDVPVTSKAVLGTIIQQACRQKSSHISIMFCHLKWSGITGKGVPQLNFDQMNLLGHQVH